ncbi:hypothetical protein KKF81_07425 [Candidatus Micrarchaeota archaeon]|nr:hypothetical protein [Candidatus Micrarchaeota archaeon]MBU1166760.1 hypothetical protein [Candidatus Micrarchaeota archaeon]MBU1887242.1 hypothetical protein [Candidatus Micrarchaeota archaeon]
MTLQARAATGIQREAGSVGATWPARFEPENGRTKGFFPEFVRMKEQAYGMLGTAKGVQIEHPESTRSTVRAFVRRGLTEGLRVDERLAPYKIEAVVPVDHVIPDYDMVYFAWNEPARRPDERVCALERRIVVRMADVQPTTHENAMQRIRKWNRNNCDYTIERITSLNPIQEIPNQHRRGYVHVEVSPEARRDTADVDDLETLYAEAYQEYTFQITRESIQAMAKPENIFLVARENDHTIPGVRNRIVSAMIAECCELEIDGRQIRLIEFSDFATRIAHEGNGIMTALQMEAIRIVREEMAGGSVVYTETRAPWTPVNVSVARVGFVYAGTVETHCRLEARRDAEFEGLHYGRFENLNVCYLSW